MPPLSVAGGRPALLIEAFSDRAGAGNGAAVVLLDQPAGDDWLQSVARSLRQSETAFLLPHGDAWLLRWFTPTCEVRLCGHATLASVLALQHWQLLGAGDATRFHSRSGTLGARLDPRQADLAEISLPGAPLQAVPCPTALQQLLRERLGEAAERFWSSELGYSVALLSAQAPLAAMTSLAPDLPASLRSGLVLMQPLPTGGGPQVAGQPADYQLRFFAPGLGIDEDPVTGSAHALVAPWWSARLQRRSVVGWQCSDRPGGMVCEGCSSGMIRLTGTGYLLWDGILQTSPPSGEPPAAWSTIAPGDG